MIDWLAAFVRCEPIAVLSCVVGVAWAAYHVTRLALGIP